MDNCSHICPHCGKYINEDKEQIPPTRHGRINALLAKKITPLKLIRIIDREEAARLLTDDKNAKVLAYESTNHWISGTVKVCNRELCGIMQYGFNGGPCCLIRKFEIDAHTISKDKDYIIFILADEV